MSDRNGIDEGSLSGPRSPGIVQTLEWMYRPIPFIERCRRRYGSIFRIRLGPKGNTIVVAEPAAARAVVAGDPAVYRAGDANGIVRPVVGAASLLVLDGDEHRGHRRILMPAFAAGHAHAFAETVEGITRERISHWPVGETISLQDEMEAISFEAILSVAVGAEPDDRLERLRCLMPEMMRRCASPFTLLPWFRRELGGITPYARLRRVLDEMDEVLLDGIRERRAAPDPWPDAMGLLAAAHDDEGRPLSDREIRDELVTLLMAGYETTTSGLAWSFERLMRSPEALERLRDEIKGDDHGYLDAVIKETLRLRTVVPVVARKVSEPVEVGGHRVEAGSVLMASAYLLHRDPEVYPDPFEFRPERFLEGDPPAGAYIPFGGGTRRCLGAGFAEEEMRVVLRTVLGEVRLSAPEPAAEGVARRRFTFAPKGEAKALVEGAARA